MTDQLVEYFSSRLGMAGGQVFARASTGLYMLFLAIAKKFGAGEIVVPSLCCESVALAAIYAGHRVCFADVSSDTLCISESTLEPLMSAKTRAVVVVHLYGIDAHTSQFEKQRKEYPETVFIEDIAQAIGGRNLQGNWLGGSLDYALLSFASDKILQGRGGLLLSRETSLVDEQGLRENSSSGHAEFEYKIKSQSLRNLVHALADLWRLNPVMDISEMFLPAAKHYRDVIILPDIEDSATIWNDSQDIDADRLLRMRRYDRYRSEIKTAWVAPMREENNCWRCSVLVETPAQARLITQRLRDRGLPASNHYFPLHLLFGQEPCPTAERVALRIINLWVDRSVSDDQIEQAIGVLNAKRRRY